MSNQARFVATILLLTASSASPAGAQFIMGPPAVRPRAGSFFFGVGRPGLASSAPFAGPFIPSFGFYALAPTRVLPASPDSLLMPPNAEDARQENMPAEEPGGAAIPRRPSGGDAELPPPRLRIANEESMARARRFIDFGDASFRRQEFARAYGRYRKAAESAPNLAEAYFRQALAQSAVGQYPPAVKTIRRGLAIDADWPRSSFRLLRLYPNRAAKEAHFERLALTLADQLDSAELLFLLGVELHFDGQSARAVTFFERAVKLGLDEKLWRGFLSAARRAGGRPRGEEL